MLDILILEDDRGCGDLLKYALTATNSKLTVEVTTSHEDALDVLLEKKPRLFIMEPNFHGLNLAYGKAYLNYVKEKLPAQAIVIISASPIGSDDISFFKSHGVSIFMEKPSRNKLVEDCNMLINEVKKS